MGQVDQFEITFDNDQAVYREGDLVSGTVKICNSEDVKYKGKQTLRLVSDLSYRSLVATTWLLTHVRDVLCILLTTVVLFVLCHLIFVGSLQRLPHKYFTRLSKTLSC